MEDRISVQLICYFSGVHILFTNVIYINRAADTLRKTHLGLLQTSPYEGKV